MRSSFWKVHMSINALLRAAISVFGMASILSGCLSFSYVDSDNVRHVVGLVDVAVERRDTVEALQVNGFGLTAFAGDQGDGLVLGYSRSTYVSAADGACIDLQTPGPCAARREKGNAP